MKILVLSFFPAFSPPTSGGELRLLNFYRALSARHEVTLLTSTDFEGRYEEIRHGPHFSEIRFPKDEHWREAYATLTRAGLSGELSGLAFALAVSDPACRLRQVARQLAPAMDVVVHEFPYSEPIFDDGSAQREVYNAHNFEVSLIGSVLVGDEDRTAVTKLLRLEQNLVGRAERVFATSEADAEKFRLFYGVDRARLSVCPNGFDEEEFGAIAARRRELASEPSRRPKLLFVGSAHRPNVDAAQFVLDLAAGLPAFDFIIAGGVTASLAGRAKSANVHLFGVFDRQAKHELLCRADLFLNPVELGSGTSLKAVEALAAGLPMVSTEEGVRGLGVRNGQDAVVIGRAGFGEAIRLLAANPAARERIASSGRDLATRTLGWSTGAKVFEASLAAKPVAAAADSGIVLALNDYPLDGTDAGGKVRMQHLLANLDADVVLLTFGPGFDVRRRAPNLLTVTIPKTKAHCDYEENVNGDRPVTASDCVAALFVPSNLLLGEVLALLLRRASAAVFEHCYMAGALDLIDALAPGLPVVYSAHNIEATQKRVMLRNHPACPELAALTADLESALETRADLVVCCTARDAEAFRQRGRTVIEVPNGAVVPSATDLAAANRGSPRTEPVAGFVGSGHEPNVEAARFILRELAPRFPEVRFDFVGSVCASLGDPVPANVRRHGVLSDADKALVMAGWTLALNPLANGGGSSVKLPDYMSHALPSISTPVGARGFAVEEEDAGLVIAREQFPQALAKALADPEARRRWGEQAHRYALARLDWSAVTEPYRAALRALRQKDPTRKKPRSLLVVTYRYTEPTLGGAEEYLVEVLKRLRPHFARVDLAASDVQGLTNHHHFATRYDGPGRGAAARVSALFDRACFFPVDVVPDAELIERCRQLELAWAVEEQQLAIRLLGAAPTGGAALLAGFYGPESQDGAIRRWTAPRFLFGLPAGASLFRLAGHVPHDKVLQAEVLSRLPDGRLQPVASASFRLHSRFILSLRLPALDPSRAAILAMRVDEHLPPDDHRPLGTMIESASVLVEKDFSRGPAAGIAELEERPLDLSENPERWMRLVSPEQWVDRLLDVAARRPPALESHFAAVRGPHSRALQDWLAREAGRYDVVLVQGIPFDTIPRSVETLAQSASERPRIVTLPHFHSDDRFYYWRRYLDAFAQADKTLLFSRGLAGRLQPEARFALVPGGGVDRTEAPTSADRAAFRAQYRGDRPFFLVLGRKTGSKGYKTILDAHAALPPGPGRPDLVLIGPDEDGLPVEQRGVFYLGRQPRPVVLGALASTIGLVTMSESESFGIVLCEAWAFGKPVIANKACLSFRELVRDGENGFLVGSAGELAAAMRRLSQSAAEAARLGADGRATVERHYSWDQVARAVREAL